MAEEYVTTMVLPGKTVEHAAGGGTDMERKHASVALEVASQGAIIARLDQTVGKLVDQTIAQGRRIGEATTHLQSLRVEMGALLESTRAQTRIIGLGLLAIAFVIWMK